MKSLTYDAYLTEAKLWQVLNHLFRGSARIYKQRELSVGTRVRAIDYTVVARGKTLLVEFDGWHHYSQFKVQQIDSAVTKAAKNAGFLLVRVPYWLQLDNNVVSCMFGEFSSSVGLTTFARRCRSVRINYPHGFIDSRALLPCDYNATGAARYKRELSWLYDNGLSHVADEIQSTATRRIETLVSRYGSV